MTDFLNGLMSGNVLETLLTLIIQLLTTITNIILYPFNILIDSLFPNFTNALDNITALFDLATTYISWILSFLGIPAILLSLVLAYYVFSITITLGVWGAKLALKWVGHFL